MRRWKKVVAAVAAALFLLYVLGDPPIYFAKPIYGKVVNKQTGEGLAGVVVLAEWKPYHIGIGHGGTAGSIKTSEAVTDSKGKYFIPAWGPRLRSPLSYMSGQDPELRYFKGGFYPEGRSNGMSSYETRDKKLLLTSEWDGKVIELKPFDGADWEEYAWRLSNTWQMGSSCLRDCPRLVIALEAENKRVNSLASRERIRWSDINTESFSEGDRAFFKRYKNKQN